MFKITYLGYAGLKYAIQESTNLVNWVPLLTNQVPLDGLLRFLTTNPPAKPRAFYRASLIPGQSINGTPLTTNLSPVAVSALVGANGAFNVTYQGSAGSFYALEESTNLLTWVPRITNQVPQSGILPFSITNPPTKGRAFYRARLLP